MYGFNIENKLQIIDLQLNGNSSQKIIVNGSFVKACTGVG